jgi:hypothetical protein
MSESPNWQWDIYYKAVPNTPKDTLLKALQLFDNENCLDKTAIDIGCGHGPDTFELISCFIYMFLALRYHCTLMSNNSTRTLNCSN